MDTLFTHVSVVTMDNALTVLTDAFVGITDGKISHLSKTPPAESDKPQTIIDATGMVMMPGLVNCHTHLPMSFLRGYADDYDLDTWLHEYIFPREDRLDARAVKAATLLSIAECLRFGITSVSDMYMHCDAIAEAVAEAGIKANLSRGTTMFIGDDFDEKTFPACVELRELKKKWHGYDNGRIQIEASIHGEYTSTHQLWDYLSRYCAEEGIGMHIHLSETEKEHNESLERNGLTPAQVLDCHHVFDGRAQAAHCVHLTEEDMTLLGKRKVTAVHCPVSNLKLASGRADVLQMVKHGMNVALGTDGSASNNNLDMFEEMKLCALNAKEQNKDAGIFGAQAALTMATVCGARAQGREKECGMLKVGMDADLCLLDFTQPHLIPCHNLMSHLVYAASGHDVVLTMVRGKILYSAGTYPTIDMGKVLEEFTAYTIPKVFSDEEAKA
ncbi:MAG: amidohydrolase [Oscillospiraceae bacterium]|nr:amidohydrolase [Oscillospiraceae bacterium]